MNLDNKQQLKEMYTLVIVDEQNDFGSKEPKGALYVEGGEKTIDPICELIEKYHNQIHKIIPTLDWHNYQDYAFTEPGITWPPHCRQNSWGAALPEKLLETFYKFNMNVDFFYKGNCDEKSEKFYHRDKSHTEYGAFENHKFLSNVGEYDFVWQGQNRNYDSTVYIYTSNIIVCGIAGDYCVLNTIKNIIAENNGNYDTKHPMLNVQIFKEGIASIDGGKKLDEFMKLNNLKEFK